MRLTFVGLGECHCEKLERAIESEESENPSWGLSGPAKFVHCGRIANTFPDSCLQK